MLISHVQTFTCPALVLCECLRWRRAWMKKVTVVAWLFQLFIIFDKPHVLVVQPSSGQLMFNVTTVVSGRLYSPTACPRLPSELAPGTAASVHAPGGTAGRDTWWSLQTGRCACRTRIWSHKHNHRWRYMLLLNVVVTERFIDLYRFTFCLRSFLTASTQLLELLGILRCQR